MRCSNCSELLPEDGRTCSNLGCATGHDEHHLCLKGEPAVCRCEEEGVECPAHRFLVTTVTVREGLITDLFGEVEPFKKRIELERTERVMSEDDLRKMVKVFG